mgnify:CR=1 FL=1
MVRAMTETNLKSAFSGESQAHMRYVFFSERAEKNGLPLLARLFKAIAYAERVHASNHYNNIRTKGGNPTFAMAGFGSRNSSEDLEIAIEGETYEVSEMYPAYLEVAKAQKEYSAEVAFRYAWEAEKTHAEFFKKAKRAVDSGRDLELGSIGVCEICGYTVEGVLPEECPICKAKKDKFRIFS